MTRKGKKVFPVPQVFKPGEWSIKESLQSGEVDLVNNVLSVPFFPDAESVFIRMHEYMHILKTPSRSDKHSLIIEAINGSDLPEITEVNPLLDLLVNAVEDSRCNHFPYIWGRNEVKGKPLADYYNNIARPFMTNRLNACIENHKINRKMIADTDINKQTLNDAHLTGMYIAYFTAHTTSKGKFRPRLPESVKEALTQTETADKLNRIYLNMNTYNQRTFELGVLLAYELYLHFLSKMEGDSSTDIPEKLDINKKDGSFADAIGSVKFTVSNLPLNNPQKRKRKESKAMPTDLGGIVKYPFRLPVTGSPVFIRKVRRPVESGMVLIDGSGSMRLDREELIKLVDNFPGYEVGIYSGRSTTGKLRIVADKGKVADSKEISRSSAGSGNVCDVQALTYLSKQKGRKIWISDGIVTGKNDDRYSIVDEVCNKIIRGYDIERYDKMDGLNNRLSKKTRLKTTYKD